METQRTFGLNKNVGFLPAALLVAILGLVKYYVLDFLINNVIGNVLGSADANVFNLVITLVDVALIAGIFLILLYVSVTTLKTKRGGFILGAITGLAITAIIMYDYYNAINGYLDSGDVMQYFAANLLLWGSLLVLYCGCIGAAFAYLAQRLAPRDTSSGGRIVTPFVIFLGLAFAFEAINTLILSNLGNLEPAPYLRWAVRGVIILAGASVILRVYRSIPEIPAAAAAPSASDSGGPAFSVPAPVVQPASAAQSAPAAVAISVPVRVRTAAPAATTPVTPPVVASPAQPAPAPVAGSRFCDQCGSENKIGAHFCAKCGNKLE
jgi:hypothetical protein